MVKHNKLIAEFMDLRSTGLSIYKPSEYEYHKSWDWLIPVIEKCRKIQIKGSQRLIDNINMKFMTLDLLGTWGNIINFIKWYNDGKKQ